MKKLTALALALLMLVAIFAMASCNDTTPKTTEAPSTSPVSSVETVSTEEPWPTRKLNDATLKILGRPQGSWMRDFIAEELNEEPINDGVYNRNEWLKQNYGYTLDVTCAASDAEWLTAARDAIKAGTGAYDFFVGSGRNMSTLAQEGSLIDIAQQENIDLEAPWWDKSATHDLSIAGRVFITTGALSTADIASTYVVFVNKTTLESKEGFENPYQLVYDKKWTMSKMLEMTRDYAEDLNGDGKWDFNDAYGYVCENYDSYAMFFSSGETVVAKDADDMPVLSVYNSRAVDFVNSMKEFYSDNSVLVAYSREIIPINQDGRSVFCGTILNAIGSYRAMEDDFGILPMPMYEEGQEKFVHSVSVATTGSLVGIPTCTEDVDVATYMVELLCRKSLETLHEDYLVTTVTHNSLQDKDSYNMLNIIVESRVFDVAYMNDWGGWMSYLYSIAGTPANADRFASQYDAQKGVTEKAIQATVDAYQSHFDE